MVIINKWYICGMEGEYGYYDDGDSKLVRMDFKSAMEVLLAGGTVTRVGYGVMGRQGGQGLRFNVSKLLVFKDGIIRNTDVMGPQGAYEWTIMREDTLATMRDIHIGDMLKSGGDKFDIAEYKITFEKQVKQTILWYMLQYFATSVYKEITGHEVEKGEIVMAKGANPFK